MEGKSVGHDREIHGNLMEWEPERKIARITWQGNVTLEALRLQSEAFRLRPEVGVLKGIIIDFTHSGTVDMPASDVLNFTEDSPVFPSSFPRVMVAEKDLHFGLLRMYETLTAERRTGTIVVRTLAEAYRILGLQDPVFVPLPTP